ncbi:MAG: GntR family transcriptional regulator [Paracoccaceae bacterium]|nr:GntR family transcriptional regulator [Paracoccaceae bacterium]
MTLSDFDATSGGTAAPLDLHSRLIAQIRDLIVRGALPSGDRVPEAHLSETLNVSRTPLREALKALSVEGLVTLRPNRGAVVTPMDIEDLKAVFETKGVIEHFIGLNASDKASDEDITHLKSIHDQLVAAEIAHARADYTELNERFHRRMAELAGNAEIVAIYERLQTKVLRARYRVNDDPRRVKASLVEHEGIMAALRIRARFDVADRLVRHNSATAEAVVSCVMSRN